MQVPGPAETEPALWNGTASHAGLRVMRMQVRAQLPQWPHKIRLKEGIPYEKATHHIFILAVLLERIKNFRIENKLVHYFFRKPIADVLKLHDVGWHENGIPFQSLPTKGNSVLRKQTQHASLQ